jgi:hypothetical protein
MELLAVKTKNAKVKYVSMKNRVLEKFVAHKIIVHPLHFIQNLDAKM